MLSLGGVGGKLKELDEAREVAGWVRGLVGLLWLSPEADFEKGLIQPECAWGTTGFVSGSAHGCNGVWKWGR